MLRTHLFRWWKRTQLDTRTRSGWLSVGLDRRDGWHPFAYWSPDATPVHPRARHYLGDGRS